LLVVEPFKRRFVDAISERSFARHGRLRTDLIYRIRLPFV